MKFPLKTTLLEKPFPWRVFSRVVLLQSFLVLLALAVSGFAARYFYKQQILYQVEIKLRDALTILSRTLPVNVGSEWCAGAAKGTEFRFTVISPSGKVICDSHHEFRTMETHLDRPEVREATQGLIGKHVRKSGTLNQEMFYSAIRAPQSGAILRGALALAGLHETMRLFDTSFGLLLFFLALALGLFALWSGSKLVFPIGRLLVKTQSLLTQTPEPLSREEVGSDFFGEWSQLESNIDNIRRDLEAKARSLDIERVELSTMMSAISDAILAVDPEGVPLFFNSRFELLFGSRELREKSLHLWEIFRDPEILEVFNTALRDGRAGATRTIAVEQKTGKTFFSLAVSPLRRQDGKIYGAVGIFHDVSDLKIAEQMRIDFVANVSHELRTPLTAIKGYADTTILDLESGKEANTEYLKIIARNTLRLMNLMEDLLDLSALESTHLLQKEALNTEDLTNRIVRQLQKNFDSKKQSVVVKCSTNAVFADSNRVEQVLVNLLDNANKYTPAGGQIFVDWEADGNYILLKIRDTGPGIPVEHQARLFERFYRVDKARSREQGGTGLGLAIVKHIMQRHEGTAWVESESGRGATFICRFPDA